jgi:hypothetical protein
MYQTKNKKTLYEIGKYKEDNFSAKEFKRTHPFLVQFESEGRWVTQNSETTLEQAIVRAKSNKKFYDKFSKQNQSWRVVKR